MMACLAVQYDEEGCVVDVEAQLEVHPAPFPPLLQNEDEDVLTIEAYMCELDHKEERRVHEFYAAHPNKRRKKQATCTHWLGGLCVKGALECEYLHDASPHNMPICKFFAKGQCTNEDMCVFRHVLPPPPPPVPCPRYVEGFCPLGTKCTLAHTKSNFPIKTEWEKCGFPRDYFVSALHMIAVMRDTVAAERHKRSREMHTHAAQRRHSHPRRHHADTHHKRSRDLQYTPTFRRRHSRSHRATPPLS